MLLSVQPPWRKGVWFLVLVCIALAVAGTAHCQQPPFSTFNCEPTGNEQAPCKRVKWQHEAGWYGYREAEAVIREAHQGLAVRMPNPWLELGRLTKEEAPKCKDLHECALFITTTNDAGEVVRVTVRMRYWNLRAFVYAWTVAFDRQYRDRLDEAKLQGAVTRAIVNAEYKLNVNVEREAWK